MDLISHMLPVTVQHKLTLLKVLDVLLQLIQTNSAVSSDTP